MLDYDKEYHEDEDATTRQAATQVYKASSSGLLL